MNIAIILAAVYGTLVGGNMVKAPYMVKADGANRVTAYLAEPVANSLGYKLVEDIRPSCSSNEYAVATGWTEDTRLRRTYEIKTIVNPPRRFYKYDISAACIEADFLPQLMQFINDDPTTKWMWDAAEILVEDDPFFVSGTNAVISAGIPEAKVKGIIDRAHELGKQGE